MSTPPDLTITQGARDMFRAALDSEEADDFFIRVTAHKEGIRKFKYQLDIAPEKSRRDDDLVWEADGIPYAMDPASSEVLKGASIDWVDKGGLDGAGFQFDNPNEEANFSTEAEKKFHDILMSEINPGIASHGGFVELIEIKNDTAFVHMGGGCQGCGMASVTLRQGVEARVKELIPEIAQIIDTTDHAAGENPYYEPSK